MENNVIVRKWKNTGFVKVDDLSGLAFTGESGAHSFRIQGFDADDNKQPITGTISGKFWNKDTDITTPLTGSLDDGDALVTFDPACYANDGLFVLTLFSTNGSTVTCIYCGVGSVKTSQSSTIAYPTAAIPDVDDLIREVQNVMANIPQDYSSLTGAVSKYESLTNNGIVSIVSSDLESGYWGYSVKMANSKRLRCSFLIPVRAGMVVTYSNPTMRIYFGVLATTTSGTYLQYTGWLASGAVDAEYKINNDGYMTFMVESTNNIVPSDFDSTVRLVTKNHQDLPLMLKAHGLSVYNATSAVNYFGEGLDANDAPVNTYVSVLQTGLGIAHLPGDASYVLGMLVTLCTDSNQARTTGKAQIYITSSGMKTRVLLASAWSAWI